MCPLCVSEYGDLSQITAGGASEMTARINNLDINGQLTSILSAV